MTLVSRRRPFERGDIVSIADASGRYVVWAKDGERLWLIPYRDRGFASRYLLSVRASRCRPAGSFPVYLAFRT